MKPRDGDNKAVGLLEVSSSAGVNVSLETARLRLRSTQGTRHGIRALGNMWSKGQTGSRCVNEKLNPPVSQK